jgi:hypothetical protein
LSAESHALVFRLRERCREEIVVPATSLAAALTVNEYVVP